MLSAPFKSASKPELRRYTMAHWTCGFEAGDLQYYTDQGWVFDGQPETGISSVAGDFHSSMAGRGGSYGMTLGDIVYSPNFGNGGRWLHFWYGPKDPIQNILSFMADGTWQFTVVFKVNGGIQLRRGHSGSTLVGLGVYTPSLAHWVAIELKATNVAGFCNVWIDGVLAVSYSGDCQSQTSADWTGFFIDPTNSTDSAWDDFIVTTEAEGRLEEHFLTHMTLSGNDVIGSGAGSTGGAGTYANADEIPPDEGTTYNEFTAAGSDRYLTTNLGYTPSKVHGVTVMGQAARDGTITQAQTICAVDAGGGAVEGLGTISGLGAGGVYAPWQDTFTTDPSTSRTIVEANTTTDFFGVAGDVASDIVVGSIITVVGSTANDGDWIVESVAYNDPNTEIVVTGTLGDATADGTLSINFTGAALDDLRVGVKFS
jgi:hypothetical protein